MVVKYLLAKLQEMLDFTHNLRPPLCFHLEMEQKQTTSELSSLENEKELKAKQDEYTQLVGLFNEEILGKGGLLQRRTQILREEFYTKLETDFPGWNEDTAFVLYNLFTERADYKGATIEYIDLCAIIGCIGYIYKEERLKKLWNRYNKTIDERIDFDTYLSIIYHYDRAKTDGVGRGLANAAAKWGRNCSFAANISIGNQLEYGLY